MLSERNTVEQITTIAVVVLIVAGTAWLLTDLARRPWDAQVSGTSCWPRSIRPAQRAWSGSGAPQPLCEIEADVARAGRTGPKAG